METRLVDGLFIFECVLIFIIKKVDLSFIDKST